MDEYEIQIFDIEIEWHTFNLQLERIVLKSCFNKTVQCARGKPQKIVFFFNGRTTKALTPQVRWA